MIRNSIMKIALTVALAVGLLQAKVYKIGADFIKIDGSLIKHINTQQESYIMVATIVNFAKQMKIKTIGEFIEDEEILKTVKELGIDYSQGYRFSPPKREI